ncbi:cell wall transcription factor ACE2 [Staphylotrichum tortipilum]|uniref:Cell wall transcription factor ACE2 n=1 Tax=Staphylotrichum tortipilum TaxID=2831512 RepID=A0AAN6MMR8_9PEZI|nr:cell wall transcription factor ACE2 [Staphylotrichum longicolle]
MSVAYEPRPFLHDGGYPPMDGDEPMDTGDHGASPDADHFPPDASDAVDAVAAVSVAHPVDAVDAVVNELANSVANFAVAQPEYVEAAEPGLDLPIVPAPSTATETPKGEASAVAAPHRTKAIARPYREVSRNQNGKFECTWADCTERTREFKRRCEWDKHMDKHERPYKCVEPTCQKLLGFTYSGGLLRHEREVHKMHGGPKNPVFCPHAACKRFVEGGHGFTRQENLNEHMRRVHTRNGVPVTDDATSTPPAGAAETEDSDPPSTPGAGAKRKRTADDDDDDSVLQEIKRVRDENEELRKQMGAQNEQTMLMMQKIVALQNALGTRLSADPAPDAPTADAPML